MALINASSFGNLAAVSVNVSNTNKEPGKFFNVCITTERRGKMNGGYYQCPVSYENDGDGDFFILNEDKVYFLPLYIKKYFVKYEVAKSKDGKDYDRPMDFIWKDATQKPADYKTEYIVAGYLWDKANSNIVSHPKDLDENGIKAGDPVLIYFRCKGLKCSSAYELVNKIKEKAKDLPPLSDNPQFEPMISQRRFLIEATIVKKPTQYKPYNVYNFEPITKLPDELVAKLLDAANNKFLKDFDKEFDKSELIKSYVTQNNNSGNSNGGSVVNSTPAQHVDIPDVSMEENPGENFNIDI